MASVGKNIKRLRAARGMTQEQLAEALFVTRQAVSAWETGKALPNVDALEQIAAALGADVTEVIYGPGAGGDRREARSRLLWQGFYWGILLSYLVYVLFSCGYIGTWYKGLAYQYGSRFYDVYTQEVPGTYTVELDLSDPDGNVGKVLYEDEYGCRITVGTLDWNADDDCAWVVWFTTEGVASARRGMIVSGMMETSDQIFDSRFSTDETADVTVSMDGSSHPGTPWGDSFLDRNRKNFGYRLFNGPEKPEVTSVTVSVTGLMRFVTVRGR